MGTRVGAREVTPPTDEEGGEEGRAPISKGMARASWASLGAAGRRLPAATYFAATAFVALAILVGALVQLVMPVTSVPLVFLAAVLGAAALGGVGEALLASVLSYFAYAWFFGQPVRSFAIHDNREIVTMVYFLVVAVGVGSLASRLRLQLDISRAATQRATMLYELSRRTSSAKSEEEAGAIVVDIVNRATGAAALLIRLEPDGEIRVAAAQPPVAAVDEQLHAAATEAWRSQRRRGRLIAGARGGGWLLMPLQTGKEPLVILAVAGRDGAGAPTAPERQLPESFAEQVVVLLERARLSGEIAETQRYRETERLRSALLSSVSHDLRTPLASIVGAATTLQSLGDRLTPENRDSLADTIAGESRRLNRYIQNLLDMSRLDHGAIRAEAEWIDLRDIVSAARTRLRDSFTGDRLVQSIPEEAAFVLADPELLEQILVNILDNAAKYGEGRARIDAENRGDAVVLSVTDDGPGVPRARRDRIFEPFNSADTGDRGAGGTGLGLSIARGFARAMAGDVLVREAPGGRGARFEIVLPRTERPNLDLDEGGARAPTVDDDAA